MKTISTLLVCFAVTAIVVGSGTYYYVSHKAKNDEAVLNSQIISLQNQADGLSKQMQASSDPTIGWQTYTDSKTNVNFKYPPSWKSPTPSEIANGPIPYPYRNINFNNQDNKTAVSDGQNIDISTFEGIKTSSTSSQLLTLLLDVYTQGKVTHALSSSLTGSNGFMLPQYNLATVSTSLPNYIQTANGAWRGVFFGAVLTNGPSDLCNSNKITDVIVMTDGTDKVAEIISGDTTAHSYMCGSNYDSSMFTKYVSQLSVSSTNETFIKNYLNTYQYIALSLR